MLTKVCLPTVLLAWLVAGLTGSEGLAGLAHADSAAPLSVAPLDHVQYPADRPTWIKEAESLGGDGSVMVVQSGVCSTAEEADELLRLMIDAAADEFVEAKLAESPTQITQRDVTLDRQWIDSLVTRRYAGTVQRGGETSHEAAARLEFSDVVAERVEQSIRNARTGERIAVVGALGVGGLASFVIGSIVLGGLSSRQQKRG